MSHHLPALLVIAPLLSAFLVSAAGWINRRFCFPIGVIGLGLSAYSALFILLRVMNEGVVEYHLGGWAPPWGIAYLIDSLNALVALLVTIVALVNFIATVRDVREEFGAKVGQFYTLYLLMTTGLLGMVVTGDAFNLYVLLEIASLTGYGLISMGDKRAPLAALNYVYMGTIGASFYLLGVGYLYIVTGSLNMADIASLLPDMYSTRPVFVAFIFCIVGVWVKMAFFPLHAWLPNAYTHAPNAASSLIAPLMTKVMIYVMIRIIFSIFTPTFVFYYPQFAIAPVTIDEAVVWFASIAIVAGVVMALNQRNLKKMLTYIIVSEVGYMVGGIWLANRQGATGAILHIVNDAMMTLCLFLAVGAIGYKLKTYHFDDLKGIFRKMPFTMACFAVGALSIIGVPPTCGFFSKWYLILGAIDAGHYGFMVALLFSSLVCVVLFFRIFEIGYYGDMTEAHGHGGSHGAAAAVIDEAPLSMLIPLVFVSVLLIALGLFTSNIVNSVIKYAIPTIVS